MHVLVNIQSLPANDLEAYETSQCFLPGGIGPSVSGYCYLAYFVPASWESAVYALKKYPFNGSVFAFAAAQSFSNLSKGCFSASFGAPVHLNNGLKHYAHVQLEKPGQTLLRAKDVLDLIPSYFHVGAVDDLVVETAAPVTLSSPLSTTFLGAVNQTSSRGMVAVLNGINTPTDSAQMSLRSIRVADIPVLQQISLPWSTVRISNLTLTMSPLPDASFLHVSLSWCWAPSCDAPPANRAAVLLRPNSGHLILAPAVPGGFWQPVDFTCALDTDLVSSFIKPQAPFGGSPVLHLLAGFRSLPGKDYEGDTTVTEVVATFTVHIGA